ncbi:MAG TPA: lysophospholipid acyltransferase family protein [Candidatus Limnocylindria bacterium]|nr:lysophospholipid acyltransferase family protein [Candidatus Limnocylindria bacterium]
MSSWPQVRGALRERLGALDVVGAWAASTERALAADPFQRDIVFLRRLLCLMGVFSRYFAGEVRGLERLPARGPMLLVGNHSGGSLTPDTSVFFHAWYRARGLDDALIGLAFDAAFGIPGFETLMRKIGEVPASRANAQRALEAGHAVLVYPGGDHEAFRPWVDRNRIDFAGRTGFIELALRLGVPVVPVVSHGGHSSTIILSRGTWLGRLFGTERIRTPQFPIALQVPWGISPMTLPGVPLPAKITIEVLSPMPWNDLGRHAADDPAVVRRCYQEITGRMQAALDALVAEHPYPVLARLRALVGG